MEVIYSVICAFVIGIAIGVVIGIILILGFWRLEVRYQKKEVLRVSHFIGETSDRLDKKYLNKSKDEE